MKKTVLTCMLTMLVLVACHAQQEAHEHVPDGADCQHAQYCTECGELLAEYGPHDYSEQPQAEKEEYSFFVCRVCGDIKIVNQDGNLVVPVE